MNPIVVGGQEVHDESRCLSNECSIGKDFVQFDDLLDGARISTGGLVQQLMKRCLNLGHLTSALLRLYAHLGFTGLTKQGSPVSGPLGSSLWIAGLALPKAVALRRLAIPNLVVLQWSWPRFSQ